MTQPRKGRPARILVVDDDPGLLRLLTIRLRSEKYTVEPADSGEAALAAVSLFRPDLVITDLRMASMDGIALLKELQRRWPSLNVILLTAHGTIPDAVHATHSGAFAFLTKPIDKEQLLEQVRRALKTSGFSAAGDEWRAEFATRSPILEERLARAYITASTDVTVLLTGESGTGKELMARAIHRASHRSNGPLVTLDCGALADAESETEVLDAVLRASGGTIFLRNVDYLPLASQAIVMRLLAAVKPGSPDARLIASSDRKLSDLLLDSELSQDLRERITGAHIEMPSVSKRREDIPLIVAQCLEQVAAESGPPKKSCSPEAMELLASARWPDNVRQIIGVVREAAAMSAAVIITAEQIQQALGLASQLPSFDEAREEFTRGYLSQLLQLTEGNVSRAARLARRNRTDFYKLLTRHGLEPETFKKK